MTTPASSATTVRGTSLRSDFRRNFHELTQERLLRAADQRILRSYETVLEAAKRYKTDHRTACYITACERLQAAYHERGIFP